MTSHKIARLSFLSITAIFVLATGPSPFAQRLVKSYAPFWLVADGYESAIFLNNARKETIPFVLELFDPEGRPLAFRQLVAEPNGSHTLLIRELLEGGPVDSGYAVISYEHEHPDVLPAQMVILSPTQRVATNFLFAERRFFPSSQMDSAFWLPTRESDFFCVLLNKSPEPSK